MRRYLLLVLNGIVKKFFRNLWVSEMPAAAESALVRLHCIPTAAAFGMPDLPALQEHEHIIGGLLARVSVLAGATRGELRRIIRHSVEAWLQHPILSAGEHYAAHSIVS